MSNDHARTRLWRKRPAPLWVGMILAWLIAAAAAAAAAGATARRDAEAELRRQSETAAALHAAVLRSELEKHRSLPLAIAANPEIAHLLAGNAGGATAISHKLEELARQTRAAAIYVIDGQGITRAASNWRLPTSFVGADYGFRPYFTGAMRKGAAEFFALGTVSGRPGLYLARRVNDHAGRPVGVVVVKVEFDALEAEWRASGEPAYVVDPGGVILITSTPQWRFRTLKPLDAASRALTLADQTLDKGALSPLPFATPQSERPSLIAAPLDGVVREWMHSRADTATPGWTLHLLTPTRGTIDVAVDNARALAALIVTLGFGVAAVLLRRRQQAVARDRAAAEARIELERRIDERTQDLSEANKALNREIEERQQAEAAREAMRDELVQAGKLAALGQIAAGVAHEINQPVAAIRTQAETALAYLQRDQASKATRPLQRVGELTMRIGAITQELRAFSRKSDSRLGPVRLSQAVDGALLLLGGRLRQQGVRLTRDRGEDPEVLGDRFRLEQVIVNLMQNASEAMEGAPSAAISLSIHTRGSEVDLVIADNGPGVAADIRDQLFTPFVTDKPNGLGLGLVICRDIIASFGGELALRPSSVGAAFVITLRAA